MKIADLGVSNEFSGDDAFLTNTAGTPAFTPPESLSHKPGDDPYSGRVRGPILYGNAGLVLRFWSESFQAADVWSLGVTLYSLVIGKVPFHDENILALYSKIKSQALEFPEEKANTLSPEIKDIIAKMLIKNPAERITLAEIKAHDWVTGCGVYPILSEEENCKHLVEVTESEVQNSVHTVPKLDTLILVKAMIKNHSFSNPFLNHSTLAGGAKERFQSSGRSNSAPETYDCYDK